jgi:hypothetical protein
MKAVLLVCAGLLLAVRPAHAADPTVRECLDAYEASLAFKNENKLADALKRLEVCTSASCPMDIKNECVRRTTDLEAAQAAEAERQRELEAAAPPPPAAPPQPVAPPNPVATALATAPPPAPDNQSPIYRRWWFWTGAAAIVAGGVTTALILSRPETPSVSSPFPVKRAMP